MPTNYFMAVLPRLFLILIPVSSFKKGQTAGEADKLVAWFNLK